MNLIEKPIIFSLIQLSNRYVIAQDFIMHDALLCGKSSLNQLALGLDAIIIIIIMNFTANIDSEKQWWWITDRMLADRLLLYV